MTDLKKLLTEQKEAIVKDLDQVKHDEFTLKVRKSKLTKMLKQVNSALELATEETPKP
jgi:hypothetical protein